MSRWTPCKRKDFVRRLRALGFEGPYSGTRHQYMVFQQHRLTSPSNSDYSIPPQRMMLSEVATIIARQITLEEWEHLT